MPSKSQQARKSTVYVGDKLEMTFARSGVTKRWEVVESIEMGGKQGVILRESSSRQDHEELMSDIQAGIRVGYLTLIKRGTDRGVLAPQSAPSGSTQPAISLRLSPA